MMRLDLLLYLYYPIIFLIIHFPPRSISNPLSFNPFPSPREENLSALEILKLFALGF